MSLAARLPQPRHTATTSVGDTSSAIVPAASSSSTFQPPPYGSAQRVGFVPRSTADYGDGGAFPEIHVTQYPLGMGRKEKKGAASSSSSTALVPITVNNTGEVSFDAVVKQGHASHVVVHTGLQAMQAKLESKFDLSKPSQAEQDALAEETKKSLGMIVEKKTASAMPTHVAKHSKEAVFIKYTPSEQNANFNSGAKQRLIRVQEMPVDPLEPPKFKHSKLPPGAPDQQVPLMHSPPKKLTKEDQQAFYIPPAISGWKNIKGYVIPLDKRLAADGRGLQEVQVNDRFASFSDSLFLAERAARDEIAARAELAKKMQRKAREAQEAELQKQATDALRSAHRDTNMDDSREEESLEHANTTGAKQEQRRPGEYQSDNSDDEDNEGRAKRDQLRRERERELKAAMRSEGKKLEKGVASSQRERERDVSERIALGQHAPTQAKDSVFDSRLFNQEGGGLNSGFGSDDAYDLYSKPLFTGSSTGQSYRPKAVAGLDDEGEGRGGNISKEDAAAAASAGRSATSKFQADRGFKGTEDTVGGHSNGPRSKPVEFERDRGVDDDPYGLGSLLNQAAPTSSGSSSSRRPPEESKHSSSSSRSRRSRSRSRSRDRDHRR